MIKAVALDDEPPALKIVENFCGRIDYINLLQSFTKTSGALDFIANNNVDLLFLDINMPSISGIDLYRSMPGNLMVVFTTSFSEYAAESYNLDAVDYLLKPYTFSRFEQAVAKAKHRYQLLHPDKSSDENYLILKADYGIVKLHLNDILFVEGLDNYLKIHLHNQKPVVVRMTMKLLLDKLPPKQFIRVHRSYIVSFKNVESLRNKIISIGAEEIPVGRSYEETVLPLFKK